MNCVRVAHCKFNLLPLSGAIMVSVWALVGAFEAWPGNLKIYNCIHNYKLKLMLAVELESLSTTKCKVSQHSYKVCGSHDSEHQSPA